MDTVFLKILNMSISSCWIVLVVILLRFVLKKAPKWINCVLWGIAGLRLILPFSLESIFSLIPSPQTLPQEVLGYEGTQLQQPAVLDVISNPIFSESISVDLGQTVDRVQLRMTTMTAIWLLGIAVLLIYTLISYLRLKRKVGTAVKLRDNIYQSENVASPFVLGLIKPKIYLPFNINGQDMEHVIAHEQAHISRKDHLWKPLGFLILTLHWFNPLVWVGYILLCRDIELACDEKVVKEFNNEQRADYSEALLTCSVNRKMIAACPLAFGEVGVKNRVKSVLNYKKPAFWVIVIAVILTAVVALCFLTNPSQSTRDMLVPGTEWECKNFGLFFTVDEDGSVKGNISSPEYSGRISISYRYAGKKAVAEIFKGDWEYAQQAAEEPLVAGIFRTKDGELILDIEADNAGINQQELIFFNNETATTSEAKNPSTEEDTLTEEESTVLSESFPPKGSFENPYNVGNSARIRHSDINQKDVVYDYNASITRILTGTEAEERLKKLSSNYEEEKEALESFDLYLARVHIKYNEESTVKDRLPADLGVTAVRFDKQLQFIDPRFYIPDNVFKAADGEFYFWAPVLAEKNVSTRWLSITVGTYQGAPGIISGAGFAIPPEEKPVEDTVEFSGFTYIRRCGDEYAVEDLGNGTIHLPEFPDSLKLKAYGIVFCDDEWEERTILDVAIQGWARAYHMENDGELEGNHKILKFRMAVPEQMIETLKKRPGQYEGILADLARNYYYLIPIGEAYYAYFHLEGDDETFADSIAKKAEVLIALP